MQLSAVLNIAFTVTSTGGREEGRRRRTGRLGEEDGGKGGTEEGRGGK